MDSGPRAPLRPPPSSLPVTLCVCVCVHRHRCAWPPRRPCPALRYRVRRQHPLRGAQPAGIWRVWLHVPSPPPSPFPPPVQYREDDMRRLFEKYGRIVGCEILFDPVTKRPRCVRPPVCAPSSLPPLPPPAMWAVVIVLPAPPSLPQRLRVCALRDGRGGGRQHRRPERPGVWRPPHPRRVRAPHICLRAHARRV